jgi:hypothetical protein
MQTVQLKLSGDNNSQRYTLNLHTTDSVYGTGRPGFGIEFKSDPSRRLISDIWFWTESEAGRDAMFARAVALPAGSALLV